MGRRVALLIAAIVIAAIGTTLVYLYAKQANDRAIADAKPVKVLVATALIPAGQTADQALAAGSLVGTGASRRSRSPRAPSATSPDLQRQGGARDDLSRAADPDPALR